MQLHAMSLTLPAGHPLAVDAWGLQALHLLHLTPSPKKPALQEHLIQSLALPGGHEPDVVALASHVLHGLQSVPYP